MELVILPQSFSSANAPSDSVIHRIKWHALFLALYDYHEEPHHRDCLDPEETACLH